MDSAASAGEYGEYDSGTDGGDVPDENPEKIIYSADATVETTEFDKTLEELAALIKEYGGWVQSSSINGANYYSISRGSSYNRSADYTIRIPSDKFQTVMGSLSTLGNIPYSYTYTENVSAQYYDVQSRLTAYKTQETRLLEMMEKAQTVEDTITIEEKLTELQYKIDSLQSSLNNWDRQVNYSTISLNVQEVGEYTEQQLKWLMSFKTTAFRGEYTGEEVRRIMEWLVNVKEDGSNPIRHYNNMPVTSGMEYTVRDNGDGTYALESITYQG